VTTAELIDAAKMLAGDLPACGDEVRWYLFGSALRDASRSADFDIAVVCRPDLAPLVRKHLAPWCTRWPVHLMILTPAEDASLRFTEEQGAVCIYP
jgi:predicted nucleotidyltransferase